METGHKNAGRLDIVMKAGHRNGDCSLYSGIEAGMETAGHRNVGRLDIVRKPDAEMGTVAYTQKRRLDTTMGTGHVNRLDTAMDTAMGT